MGEKWRLGEDLSVEDNMLDGITFADIILAVHHNCREITPEAIRKEVLDFVEMPKDHADSVPMKSGKANRLKGGPGRCLISCARFGTDGI